MKLLFDSNSVHQCFIQNAHGLTVKFSYQSMMKISSLRHISGRNHKCNDIDHQNLYTVSQAIIRKHVIHLDFSLVAAVKLSVQSARSLTISDDVTIVT